MDGNRMGRDSSNSPKGGQGAEAAGRDFGSGKGQEEGEGRGQGVGVPGPSNDMSRRGDVECGEVEGGDGTERTQNLAGPCSSNGCDLS